MKELTKEQMEALINLCRVLVLTKAIDAIDIQPILKDKSWKIVLKADGEVAHGVLYAKNVKAGVPLWKN